MRANNKRSGSREAGAGKGGPQPPASQEITNRIIAELERGTVPVGGKPMRRMSLGGQPQALSERPSCV